MQNIEMLKTEKATLETSLVEIKQRVQLEAEIRTLKRRILWGKIVLKFNRLKIIRFLRWLL